MRYAYRFRLDPTPEQRELLDHHRDTCRQLYNHALNEFEKIPESAGTLDQRVRQVRDQLTDLKGWWDDLNDLYSTVAQAAVMRIEDSIKALSQLKQSGYNVGSLNWKAPEDFRSFTYIQSGFEFDSKNGQTGLSLSKLADVPLIKHRTIPDTETIKQVTIKKEPTGDWFASFVVDGKETPEKPTDPDRCVGIDVGILKYAHDTDGYAIESPDFSAERDRLERAQRDLSRKEHGSTNWETHRQIVAERHADLKRKRRDFLHKLARYYVSNYDVVAVEDLNVRGMMQQNRNSRNTAHSAWRTFIEILRYKAESAGTHLVEVNPRGTTKECSNCGVGTDKPLWVREHSCPSCGYEDDRDGNAAKTVLQCAFSQLGMGQAESTPPETATATDTHVVSARRVIERGSPTLNARST